MACNKAKAYWGFSLKMNVIISYMGCAQISVITCKTTTIWKTHIIWICKENRNFLAARRLFPTTFLIPLSTKPDHVQKEESPLWVWVGFCTRDRKSKMNCEWNLWTRIANRKVLWPSNSLITNLFSETLLKAHLILPILRSKTSPKGFCQGFCLSNSKEFMSISREMTSGSKDLHRHTGKTVGVQVFLSWLKEDLRW